MTTLDANMARLEWGPPVFFVNDRVNLDDLLNSDISIGGIVRVCGAEDVRTAVTVVSPQASEMVGCIAGWISDDL